MRDKVGKEYKKSLIKDHKILNQSKQQQQQQQTQFRKIISQTTVDCNGKNLRGLLSPYRKILQFSQVG